MESTISTQKHIMDSPKAESHHEFQQFLNSLPKETGPAKETLYFYNGFWCTRLSLEGLTASQKQFQARDSDTILITFPKTGTTWLKSLVFAIARRTQHPISDPNHPFTTSNSHELVPFVHYESMLPPISNAKSPRLLSAHFAYSMLPESVQNSKCRFIYLCRNPKDVFVSTWHFKKPPRESEPITLEESFDKFCEGVTWYGPYWEHVLEYWKLGLERPDEVLFLKYEDLKGDILSQLKKIAEHLGCPFSVEEEDAGVIEGIVKLCSIDSRRNLEVNKTGAIFLPVQVDNRTFFRKGEVGDWKNLITPSMADKLDQLFEQKLRGSGLTFS